MPDSLPKCINAAGENSRILLPQVPILEQELRLRSPAVTALKCWQARLGEIFTVCDPQGSEYRARLTWLDADTATLLPFAKIGPTESPIKIDLYQALPEKERFELILQKAVELGVSRIVPITCRRSTSLQERDAGQKKSHRWPNVLLRAARQCRRAVIPELYSVIDWSQALAMSSAADLTLLCYEGEGISPMQKLLRNSTARHIALLIGPEGGFAAEEVEQARRSGIAPVSLGPRILRTETAAIIAAGMVQYVCGDLSRS